MAKFSLCVTRLEAKAACGTDQLAGGVEAEIEGGIHAMRLLWTYHSHDEDFVFSLIDARNAFNKDNWAAMLWAV